MNSDARIYGITKTAGAIAIATMLYGCTPDKPISAITLEVKIGGKVAKLLTRNSVVDCISGFDTIPTQKGNGIDVSDTSSGGLSRIKTGDRKIITRTLDGSTVMISNEIDTSIKIAYFHTKDKNMTPKMRIYEQGQDPSSDFCIK
ncbi:hypothetical protein H7169_00635 [Candidatus Gracilibacteria bacterium]|nr:hypothetical protein [Candidatus Gracilibacteria bacterium]